MTFKMVTDSEKAAGRTAGTAGAHAKLIAGDVTARWHDRLGEGQEYIDVNQLQLGVREALRAARALLNEKVALHLKQLEKIDKTRQRRDVATPELRALLYKVRDFCKTVFGESAVRSLFKGKPLVPVDPVPLRRVARRVVNNLEDPGFVLPAEALEGVSLTRADLARQIKGPLKALEAAFDDLEAAQPRANATLEEKKRAHAELDDLDSRAARFLEGFYALAGHDVLAASVRRSTHRSRRDDAQPQEAEQAAADESASEATLAPETAPEPTAEEPLANRNREAAAGVPPAPSTSAERAVLAWPAPRSGPTTPLQYGPPPRAGGHGKSRIIRQASESTQVQIQDQGTQRESPKPRGSTTRRR